MNLRQLEVFYAVMKAGTVSGAARSLHVSQPNVTRILAHTEQQLGFALFERVKGRLTPTQEALALLPEAEKIYQQLGLFHTLTQKVGRGTQHLRIGAPPVLASTLLPPVIAILRRQSNLSIDLITGNKDELSQGLLRHELDIAVAFGDDTPPGLNQELLTTGYVQVIALERAMEAIVEPLTLAAMVQSGVEIIGLDTRDPLGGTLNRMILALAPQYQHALTVRSYSAAVELAKLGLGMALVDPWTAQGHRDNAQVQVAELSPQVPVHVSLYSANHQSPSAASRLFITRLKAQVSGDAQA
ncbi:LysR family transcriptional regulator [Photobacterium atrarenae]|uniref:LysR family transcriptional regulator n=1 Tax=Photobacterium atrarenae TaxID=865757 RepID=A0ABY5GJV5_9GAMM|nr:LysR family transcriptional regulator [Photobacterium atrarenae]UTV29602.1 LysR family transcriptional regulator [Photobacterium atrarenae]